MGKQAVVRVEKVLKRNLAGRKGLDDILLSVSGISLGLSFTVIMFILTGGASVLMKNIFVFVLCVISGLLSISGLVLSDKMVHPQKRKIAKVMNLIAGIPMWYLIAGITYAAGVVL